jgi:hypothetical protein
MYGNSRTTKGRSLGVFSLKTNFWRWGNLDGVLRRPGISITIDQTAAFNLAKTVGADPRLSKKM